MDRLAGSRSLNVVRQSLQIENYSILRYVDHRLCPPCRTRRPVPAEGRPKFISVMVITVTRRVFNFCENCYKSGMPNWLWS
jgi:hypothetical protein